MSGHSKWSTIKHKKGIADQRRGTLFTRLSREITVAAKSGDADPSLNFRLRLAVENAKSQNMPKDNIQRAIQRAKGASGDAELHEISYEAYGPGGSGLVIQTLTDNKNRSFAAVRTTVSRNGGTMANSGSVLWNFTQKGSIVVEVLDGDAEEVALELVDSGVEDFEVNGSSIEAYVPYNDFAEARDKISKLENIKIETAELVMSPNTLISLDKQKSKQIIKMVQALEEVEDVQKVFLNADLDQSAVDEI